MKVSLIGPDRIYQAYDSGRETYADDQAFLDAVVAVQREMVDGLAKAGCGYVHMDAPGFTAYVDPRRSSASATAAATRRRCCARRSPPRTR